MTFHHTNHSECRIFLGLERLILNRTVFTHEKVVPTNTTTINNNNGKRKTLSGSGTNDFIRNKNT